MSHYTRLTWAILVYSDLRKAGYKPLIGDELHCRGLTRNALAKRNNYTAAGSILNGVLCQPAVSKNLHIKILLEAACQAFLYPRPPKMLTL